MRSSTIGCSNSRRNWSSASVNGRACCLTSLFVDRDHRPQAAGHPALAAALDVLRRGGHAALVVAIFDRFARLDAEYGALRARAATEGWTLILAS